MTRNWLNMPGLIAGLFLVVTPAFAQQTSTENVLETILAKLASIEQRLSKLEQGASPGSSGVTVDSNSDVIPADVDSRLNALDQQIQIAARRREREQSPSLSPMTSMPSARRRAC